jgi:hypothetical protein
LRSVGLHQSAARETARGVIHGKVGIPTLSVVTFMLSLINSPNPAQADEILRQSLPPGGIADIRAIDGTIRVMQGGTAVTVSAHVTTLAGSLVDLHVVDRREGAVWVVCTVPPEQLSCSGQGHEGIHADGDTRIDLTVTLPSNVKLNLDDVSGMIETQSLANDVDAHSVSGRVSITANATVSARTETGDIFVRLGQTFGAVKIDSKTGSVAVQLPRNANGRIEARTISGDVVAKGGIKLSDNAEIVGRDQHAVLGLGGSTITIHTIGGSITLDTW